MRLRDFHCESLEIFGQFDPDDFDKAGFVEDVNPPSPTTPFSWAFGTREEGKEEHAHISIEFPPEKLGKLRIAYHNGATPSPDVRPPYMEDCAQWLGGFFKPNELRVLLTASYELDNESPGSLALPFPLMAVGGSFVGAMVTGITIDFPKGAAVEHAHLEREGESMFVSISTRATLDLKEFDPYAQLKTLEDPLNALLVRKR